MIHVTYCITFDYNRFYSEQELKEGTPELLNELSHAPAIEGAIVIQTPENTVEIRDELLPWIQNVCFLAIPDLSEGEPVHIDYFSRSGYIDLTPSGGMVKITGNLIREITCPQQELLQQLFECGKRFIAYMKTVKKNDADFMANLNYIATLEAPARRAL